MKDKNIDYAKLIDKAMHDVVKSVLRQITKDGLPGQHHFFITFKTDAQGVMMSDELRKRYPKEMTIVLQHQFYDLEVEDQYFSIVLSFDHVKQNITIPFSALVSFVDPSVKFGLQFNTIMLEDADSNAELISEGNKKPASKKNSSKQSKKIDGNSGSNVVTLDSFRKKD
ncbi:MAG: ClpXP protease specificity-enhancing factor SspB [Rickettsiales bacterium]|nr:ClpXP protease specificity-enhancing factor SspB [Rickettsiales bacterium]